MYIQIHSINDGNIAEIISDELLIQNVDDALDLMGDVYYQGFDRLIIHHHQLVGDFFDLKSKLAGDILQKFSNYRIRLVIVGDFSMLTSESLKDFIYESNNGKQINFVHSLEEGISRLRD